MPGTGFPFQMAGGVPVVTAPPAIDTTTAGQLRAILLEWHSRGHTTVVVDMTGTRLCDRAGLTVLARSHQRARARGGGLRLVIPADGDVLRALSATSLDRFIPLYASREQALAQVPAAVTRRRPGLRPEPPGAPAGPPAHLRDQGVAADSRACEQCGAVFAPQREHARFCTAGCRAAWNREHMGDPAVEASALAWSVTALSEATALLSQVKAWDQPRGFAAIAEAVWWVTMVDATLVRHHPKAYEGVMSAQAPAERRLISQTLAGLRFVRNRIAREGGLGEVIETGGPREDGGPVTAWTWKSAPAPALARLPPRAQAWETARHRAYQAHLAGHTVGEVFGQTVTFLTLTGASAASATGARRRAGRPSPAR